MFNVQEGFTQECKTNKIVLLLVNLKGVDFANSMAPNIWKNTREERILKGKVTFFLLFLFLDLLYTFLPDSQVISPLIT